jgi:hypothetical protein
MEIISSYLLGWGENEFYVDLALWTENKQKIK